MLAAKLFAYAQGFDLLTAAAKTYGWSLDLAAIARVWTGGCIIRAALLDPIIAAWSTNNNVASLMLADFAQALAAQHVSGLRHVVAQAQAAEIPVPALSSALAWFDALKSASLPQNLIQAQRDAFGAHGFQRLDTPDKHEHADW